MASRTPPPTPWPAGPRRACRRGSVALEEVMTLAVMLPIVVTAVTLGARIFAMFSDVIAALTGSPYP